MSQPEINFHFFSFFAFRMLITYSKLVSSSTIARASYLCWSMSYLLVISLILGATEEVLMDLDYSLYPRYIENDLKQIWPWKSWREQITTIKKFLKLMFWAVALRQRETPFVSALTSGKRRANVGDFILIKVPNVCDSFPTPFYSLFRN